MAVISRSAAPSLLTLLLILACAERTPIPGGDDETGPPPGEPFAGCIDKGDCDEDWCLHPAGEPGFCTYPCQAADECEPGPNGTATVTCLPAEGSQVCALDCSGGKSCPAHMRCEQILADDEPRAICF